MGSDNTRWYHPDGSRCDNLTTLKGMPKQADVRDAKKLGLVPSVTSVLSIIEKPMLTKWKVDVAIDCCLTLPKQEGESLDEYKKRVKQDAIDQSLKPAGLGTKVHEAINSYLDKNMYVTDDEKVSSIMEGVKVWLESNTMSGHCEKSFACNRYAGTIDFYGKMMIDGVLTDVVADFKTSSTKVGERVNYYPEWIWQLTAYRNLIRVNVDKAYSPALVNIVISTTEPNRIEYKVYDESAADNGYDIFGLALSLYRKIKGLE